MSSSFDKSKLPSRHTTVGPERAPHRSFYYAMDLTRERMLQDLSLEWFLLGMKLHRAIFL